MIGHERPITLSVKADAGVTTSAYGISLGLITAELVINALKHAFPYSRRGTIVVEYKSSDTGWCLAVTDDGVGITVDPAKKEGLGTTIVQSLARQMNATVAIETSPAGTSVSINGVPRP
jgi:two-component sensor histidine kinase